MHIYRSLRRSKPFTNQSHEFIEIRVRAFITSFPGWISSFFSPPDPIFWTFPRFECPFGKTKPNYEWHRERETDRDGNTERETERERALREALMRKRRSHRAKYLTSHYNHTRSDPRRINRINLLKRLLGRRTGSAPQEGVLNKTHTINSPKLLENLLVNARVLAEIKHDLSLLQKSLKLRPSQTVLTKTTIDP